MKVLFLTKLLYLAHKCARHETGATTLPTLIGEDYSATECGVVVVVEYCKSFMLQYSFILEVKTSDPYCQTALV